MYDEGSTRNWVCASNILASGVRAVLSLEDKRMQAPEHLVVAADLVSGFIQTSSKRMSCRRQERKVRQLLGGLPESIHWRVRRHRIDLYDEPLGEPDAPFQQPHAHVAICQANGSQYYWRNIDELHGPQNYFR